MSDIPDVIFVSERTRENGGDWYHRQSEGDKPFVEKSKSTPNKEIKSLIDECQENIDLAHSGESFGYDHVIDANIYYKFFKDLTNLVNREGGK